jgi:hypothetical protein
VLTGLFFHPRLCDQQIGLHDKINSSGRVVAGRQQPLLLMKDLKPSIIPA